jgi:hypothetical protein
MKINWREFFKFASGFAFGDAVINAMLYLNNIQVSLFGLTQSRESWGLRILLQFIVALTLFYFGYLRRK